MRITRTLWLIIALTCIGLNQPSAHAGQIVINMLGNASDQSAISGTCDYGKTDTRLACTTVQVSVEYANDPKSSEQDRRAIQSEIAENFKTDSDVASFCERVRLNPESLSSLLEHPT